MNVIFIDIDGVLNDTRPFSNNYCGILNSRVEILNRIIIETGCKIVISSSWRYLIIGGKMTVDGFTEMLYSHGFTFQGVVLDHTEADEEVGGTLSRRGYQIREWLDRHPHVTKYVVVDDRDLSINECGHPFVQTVGALGLTEEDGDRIIKMLNET